MDTAAGGPGVFLSSPEQSDGTTALWHVELDLERHRVLREHLVNGQPTAPIAVLLQIAAESAVFFASGTTPVRYTDLRLPRPLRAPVERWPRRIDVIAARSGDSVDVCLGSPPVNAVPTVEHARVTVHLGTPEVPDPDDWQHPALDPVVHPSVVDHRFDGYLLPGDAFDALLRTAGSPESISAVRLVDIPVPVDDRELARLLGSHVDLRHYPTPDGERYTATTADGTVVVRLEGVTTTTHDLVAMRRHRTGARTPGRAGNRKRSAGGGPDGG